jgi:hypothetical protein
LVYVAASGRSSGALGDSGHGVLETADQGTTSSSRDAALVEAVCDLLWGGGTGGPEVLEDQQEILVTFGDGGAAAAYDGIKGTKDVFGLSQ